MKNQKKGLTLVELLVVIVIIGILAAISIGTFVRYQEKARLAKAKGIATQIKRQFAVKNILLADPNKSFQFKFLTTDDPNSYPILENSGSQLNLDKVEWRGGAAQIINDQTLGLKNVLSINQSQFIASFNQPFRTDTFTISFWLKNKVR